MEYFTYAIPIGFVVGLLVGFTGVGGAVLMMPLLILGLRVPPIIAVGTGIVFSFITKIAGVGKHWRQGNVDAQLACLMALGSVPGGLFGVAVLAHLRAQYGAGVNDILRTLIGALLVVIPLLMIAEGRFLKASMNETEKPLRERLPHWVNRYNAALITGLIGGFLVGLTSVGSGSVIMLLLLLFYRRTTNILVGTDIFHAVLLTWVTGLAHIRLGTVDFQLLALLLVGSIPGVVLGSNLSSVVPTVWLRRVLLAVLIVVGIRMI